MFPNAVVARVRDLRGRPRKSEAIPAVGLALLLATLASVSDATRGSHIAVASLCAYWITLAWAGTRLTGWLLGRLSTAERLAAVFTVTIGLQLVQLVALGHFGVLSRRHAMLAAATTLLLSRLIPARRLRPRPRSRLRDRAWHTTGARVAVFVSSVVLVVSLGDAVRSARYQAPGANSYDDNYYHLPAATEWFQHGDLRMLKIGQGDPSPAFYPIGSELVAWSHLALLDGNDFTARFTELPFALASLVAIAAVARALGMGAVSALAAALLFATIPGFPRQMLSASNDLTTAFFALASVHAIVLFARRPGIPRAAYVGCAIGLLFGTKYTALIFGPSLVVLACLASLHPRARRVATGRRRGLHTVAGLLVLISVAAGAATLTGGYTYVRNAATAGNPIYPAQLAVAGHVILPGRRSHTPEVLHRRRQAATAATQFLLNRDDQFGPLFKWTLLPASLVGPALASVAIPWSRRRRRNRGSDATRHARARDVARPRDRLWDQLLTAAGLFLPAVFFLGFIYLVADQRSIRYLFPALALAAVALAWLLERLPGAWRNVVSIVIATATAPVVVRQFEQELIHWIPLWLAATAPVTAAVVYWVGPGLRRLTRSGIARMPPMPNLAGARLWRRAIQWTRRPLGVGVLALTTLYLIVAAWTALARTAESYSARRLDPHGPAAVVDRLTRSDPAVVAIAGGNKSYLFFGRHLGNEIVYVPTYQVEEAIYYSWGSSLAMPRGPRDPQAWYNNLVALGVQYLVVFTWQGIPPEIPWIERLPCCHELLWHRGAVRIYALKPHRLAEHLEAETTPPLR